jgi:hypothetical protein
LLLLQPCSFQAGKLLAPKIAPALKSDSVQQTNGKSKIMACGAVSKAAACAGAARDKHQQENDKKRQEYKQGRQNSDKLLENLDDKDNEQGLLLRV